jgi:hypothetical protein
MTQSSAFSGGAIFLEAGSSSATSGGPIMLTVVSLHPPIQGRRQFSLAMHLLKVEMLLLVPDVE